MMIRDIPPPMRKRTLLDRLYKLWPYLPWILLSLMSIFCIYLSMQVRHYKAESEYYRQGMIEFVNKLFPGEDYNAIRQENNLP